MQFVVVRGFQCPVDDKKKYRYGVVLGMVNGRVAIAPCSSNPCRTGTVPRGSVALSVHSPAFAGTGFTVERVAISIRDVGLFSVDSRWVRRCKQAGMLDTSLDKHFEQDLRLLMKEYALVNDTPAYN